MGVSSGIGLTRRSQDGTVSDPPFASVSDLYVPLSEALVNLDATGIVTDGNDYVTAWTNSGIGGSDYDLDVVVGTLANSSVTTLNGINAVNSTGSYGLESTAGQDIALPYTAFAVARFSNASPGGSQNIYDSRSDGAKSNELFSNITQSNKFSLFCGSSSIVLTEAYDTDPHTFTVQQNGDSTTKLSVGGVGSVSGASGTEQLDYLSLFSNRSGANTMAGYIAQLVVFDRALTETEVLAMQNYLTSKFAL